MELGFEMLFLATAWGDGSVLFKKLGFSWNLPFLHCPLWLEILIGLKPVISLKELWLARSSSGLEPKIPGSSVVQPSSRPFWQPRDYLGGGGDRSRPEGGC